MQSPVKLVVFIIGTTASGKTKLSLNLSDEGNYEIISCDSMQIYRGADIMTAKATKAEQDKVPHHCIDLVDLNSKGFNRNDWVAIVRQRIKEIHSRGKVPVVVGGTTYYLEPLLFKTTDAPTSQFTDISTENPLEQLKAIDPLAAEKFHEHDIRRISNALRYHKSTGQLPSEIPDFHSAECTLLLDDVLILWPKWEKKEMLREKVRSRIHSMLHVEGGLQEILHVFEQLGAEPDGKGGVLQSIGYRQFASLYAYTKLHGTEQTAEFRKLLASCEQQLVTDTNHYTKKQLQWIKNRMVQNPNIEALRPRFFVLEFGDETQFAVKVIEPGKQIFASILKGEQPTQYMLSEEAVAKAKKAGELKRRDAWKKHRCETCDKEVNGPVEWQQHLRSKAHIKLIRKEVKYDGPAPNKKIKHD